MKRNTGSQRTAPILKSKAIVYRENVRKIILLDYKYLWYASFLKGMSYGNLQEQL